MHGDGVQYQKRFGWVVSKAFAGVFPVYVRIAAAGVPVSNVWVAWSDIPHGHSQQARRLRPGGTLLNNSSTAATSNVVLIP